MTSPLLDLSLENIAAYNDHGVAIVNGIRQSDIDPLHHPVILGMFAVYSLLIAIGHLGEDDVVFPPYTPEQFDPQEWLDVGFGQGAVDILALLPNPSVKYDPNMEVWHIEPQAWPISYLGVQRFEQDIEHTKEFVSQRNLDFNGRDLVKLDHVRLTSGGRDGNNYIYDTKTAKIINYDMWMPRGNVQSYADLHEAFFPAQDVMCNWVRNIYDLVYVPYPLNTERPIKVLPGNFEYDRKSGARISSTQEEITAYCNDPTSAAGYAFRNDGWRIEANHVVSIRRIYRAHGWPASFDKVACRRALEEFDEEHSWYRDAARAVRPPWLHVGESCPEEDAPMAELDAFLQRSAGDLAIRKDVLRRNEL